MFERVVRGEDADWQIDGCCHLSHTQRARNSGRIDQGQSWFEKLFI